MLILRKVIVFNAPQILSKHMLSAFSQMHNSDFVETVLVKPVFGVQGVNGRAKMQPLHYDGYHSNGLPPIRVLHLITIGSKIYNSALRSYQLRTN